LLPKDFQSCLSCIAVSDPYRSFAETITPGFYLSKFPHEYQ
jgi:hypothetical protein